MKHVPMALTIMALTAPAIAETAAEIDTDADGALSIEEMRVAFPDLTDDLYVALDTDEDGTVSEEEFNAAVELGLLPS